MQSNPRILVNLLVILVRILVNLLVKLTKSGIVGGATGGAYPLYAEPPSQAVFSPRGTNQDPEEQAGVYVRLMRLMRPMETYGDLGGK